jgi:hypothetical protein
MVLNESRHAGAPGEMPRATTQCKGRIMLLGILSMEACMKITCQLIKVLKRFSKMFSSDDVMHMLIKHYIRVDVI